MGDVDESMVFVHGLSKSYSGELGVSLAVILLMINTRVRTYHDKRTYLETMK